MGRHPHNPRASPRLSREELRPSLSPSTKRPSRNSRELTSDKDQRRSKSQLPPARPPAQRRSSSSQPPPRWRSVWRMGGVVEAVFVRTCRGRRKDSSTAPASETSTTTASPHSSLKSSAWSSEGSERPESNAQQKFRSAQELERAKKKAQQREHRWDPNAGSWNTTHRSEAASSPRHTPRSQSMPPRSGITHCDNDRSVTNKSPATLRLSDLTRKPKPMSQYVMANPFSSRRDAPAVAPAPSTRRSSSSRASEQGPMTAEQLAQLRAARLEPTSRKQPMTAAQQLQLRRAAVHKNSAYSAEAELARIPTFRHRQRSGDKSRQERTYDTLPPPRTYDTLSKHAAPSRAPPRPPCDSSDGLLYSLNEMKRTVAAAAYRPESPLPPGAFSA